MENWKHDRIGSCERGENPTLLLKMKSGFAVLGDHQFLPGYCLLLAHPTASSLNALSLQMRTQYLLDMTLIGDAIIQVCHPLRINYSTLMNLDHYLHTHIEARYDWEPAAYAVKPTYFYPKEQRFGAEYEYSQEKYETLKRQLTEALSELVKKAYGS